MRNGAVGRSWNSDRKTENVNPHMRKNGREKRPWLAVTAEV
jgi:hypothetical protein